MPPKKNLWFDKLTILSKVEGKLLSARLTSTSLSTGRRLSDFSRGDFLAPLFLRKGLGESGLRYFKNTGHMQKIAASAIFCTNMVQIDQTINPAYNESMAKDSRKAKLIIRREKGVKKEHFEVLLEDIDGKFDFIAESTSNLLKLPPLVEKMANDLEVVKTDVELMKGMLQRKVDTEEFEVLERRVTRLEGRL